MKKLFKITILFGLLLAIKVKADMGPPVFPSLKAEIVNEGAGCAFAFCRCDADDRTRTMVEKVFRNTRFIRKM